MWLSVCGEVNCGHSDPCWSTAFTTGSFSLCFCFLEQTKLVYWSFQLICFSFHKNSADKTSGVWYRFDDSTHEPQVAWCLADHDEDYRVEIPPFAVPLLTLLHYWQVFFGPPFPKEVCNVLYLLPSSSSVQVLFAEQTRW